ncbi:hypothetical protein PFISCL1PPCAC_5318 [Pristionchus fissidentatus]|uniref:BLOC-1-related complex subunit 5 n=1 Tax=Pristionchus fissidentatus TaxID=1538716 RepID=A0AAV5V3Q1_9BILA|nr:hypothetical protein PFISCL1PPCAC_5318 [Pristionchus fissidentatus]
MADNDKRDEEQQKYESMMDTTDGASQLPLNQMPTIDLADVQAALAPPEEKLADYQEDYGQDVHLDIINKTMASVMTIQKDIKRVYNNVQKLTLAQNEFKDRQNLMSDQMATMSNALDTLVKNLPPHPVMITQSVQTSGTPIPIVVPPRHGYSNYDSRNRNSPSTSHSRFHSRSRSPSRPYPSRSSSSVLSRQGNVFCTFCDSTSHKTRNCSEILSISHRSAIMSQENRCLRCFRLLNAQHDPECMADDCARGCVNSQNVPIKHCDWFCPLNPNLTQ